MFQKWAYASEGKRDLRFDLIRGYALFMMIVGHTGLPSVLYSVTTFSGFYFRAVEVFYLVSAIVLGQILASKPFDETVGWVLKQTWRIYWVFVSLTLFSMTFEAATDWKMLLNSDLFSFRGGELVGRIIRTFMLQNATNTTDVLVLYVIFTFLAIVAAYALRNRLGLIFYGTLTGAYVLYILADGSLSRVLSSSFRSPPFIFLYFSAFLVGWKWRQLKEWVEKIPPRVYWTVLGLLVVFGVFFHQVHLSKYAWMPGLPPLLGLTFEVKPLRFLFIWLYAPLVFAIVHYFWVPLNKITGWFFRKLGENSLWTFSVHIFVIMVFTNSAWHVTSQSPRRGAVEQLLMLAVIWLSIPVQRWVAKRLPARVYIPALLVIPILLMVPYTLPPYYGGSPNPVVENTDRSWGLNDVMEVPAVEASGGSYHKNNGDRSTFNYTFYGTGIDVYGYFTGAPAGMGFWINNQWTGVFERDGEWGGGPMLVFSLRDLPEDEYILTIWPLAGREASVDFVMVHRGGD